MPSQVLLSLDIKLGVAFLYSFAAVALMPLTSDHTPTYAGEACKIPSQRTRGEATRCFTILITILPSIPKN